MTARISPLAAVDPQARLADDVEVGPFCVVGPEAVIGAGARLESHVVLMGRVTLGRNNHLFPGAVLGGRPQGWNMQAGPQSQVLVGDGNVIREGVTINAGGADGPGVTQIGDGCRLSAGCRIGHDCRLGNRVSLAEGAVLSGGVQVQNFAGVSAQAVVHSYVTIGEYGFIGGLSRAVHDAPPYLVCEGHPARPRSVNEVALKRHEFAPETIQAIVAAHRLLFREKTSPDDARRLLREQGRLVPQVNQLLAFLDEQQEGRCGRSRRKRSRLAA